MAYVDSIDKIVLSYFHGMSSIPIEYKNKILLVRELKISPLLYRGFECVENCAGCCPRFSLDYLPEEERPKNCSPRKIKINGKEKTIFLIYKMIIKITFVDT